MDAPARPEILEAGHGQPVESIALLERDGLDRLMYADYSTAIAARFLSDAYACRYQSADQRLRWFRAADDLVAAVNVQRDRLLLWRPHEPDEPYAVVPVAQWTGHSIQHFCLIHEA